MYKFIFNNFLIHQDAERVHHLAIKTLEFASRCPLIRYLSSRAVSRPQPSFTWPLDQSGRLIPGPLGLAAGMDKEAQAVAMWDALGFGFVEIGTITPLAQPGNERPRLWRLPQSKALRNAMGFNNSGARIAARRLRRLRRNFGNRLIIGANIGKNKLTEASDAPKDYRKVTRTLAALVDFIVINVSSPNTPGLRDLQAVAALEPIVRAVQAELAQQNLAQLPLFIKIAPDLSDDDIAEVAELVVSKNLTGVVATNTTIAHNLGAGGISGEPLRPRALEVVGILRNLLPESKVIIGVGGISSVEDAQAFLDAGATLIEGLSAFVYEGPAWASRLNNSLSQSHQKLHQ